MKQMNKRETVGFTYVQRTPVSKLDRGRIRDVIGRRISFRRPYHDKEHKYTLRIYD